jgi:hypothetical protein
MKFINTSSKEGFVNLFADHLIKNIDSSHKSRLQVIDFKSFIVVYGSTTSDVILDLNKLRDSFMENNKTLINYLNFKQVNIIDLIDYNEPLSPNEYYFTYYNSTRPIFHPKVVDEVNRNSSQYNKELLNSINYTDKLELEFYSPFVPENVNIFNSTNFMSTSSTFPHGHSFNIGRNEFYYGEYISNHLFNILETDKIVFKYSHNLDSDDDLEIDLICDSLYPSDKIKSLVLDVFDFNLNKFYNDYLKNYNIKDDIKNPLESKPWLVKNRTSDLIMF